MSFDTNLEGGGCQGSLISRGGPSDTLFFAHPLGPGRNRMTVRRSDDGGGSWPHALEVYHTGAAYSCLSPMPPRFGDKIGLLFERDDAEICTQGASCLIAFSSFPASF